VINMSLFNGGIACLPDLIGYFPLSRAAGLQSPDSLASARTPWYQIEVLDLCTSSTEVLAFLAPDYFLDR
jgi:hypothetical protein